MATARTARRAPARNEASGTSQYRGAAGLRRMQEEQERAEARREANKNRVREPFRFFCSVGETREIVIVDDAPDFFRYEHQLKDARTKRWSLFTPCVEATANCPVCAASDRPSYYAMYLTIIDLTPYTNGDGEEVEWSKKLLVVKPAQQKKIARLFEKHGTLRGMRLEMTRDGEKDASIGSDIEFIEFMEDDELAEFVTEYTDKENKTHEIIGDEPYDYEEIFPEMTEKQLRAIVGGAAPIGNREDDDRELGRSNPRRAGRGGRDADNDERDEPRRSSRRAPRDEEGDEGDDRRTRAVTRRRPAADAGDERDDDPPEDRGGRTARRRPVVDDADRPARRSTRPDPDEVDEDDRPQRTTRRAGRRDPDENADDPPQRTAGRRATRRDADDPAFEPDDPPDDPPARRTGGTLAARRAALRRGG